MAIEWDSATMSTGVARVDQEHQTLIAELNALMAALRNGQGREKTTSTMAWLATYAKNHFAFEEGCMNAARCPVAAANKQAHDQFMLLIAAFQQRLESEGPTAALGLDLERYLAGWVVRHICGVDTELRKCVTAAAS